ncbi:RmlC-like cupin domain containing protein [Naviculisporaceae sp. PSN 640]
MASPQSFFDPFAYSPGSFTEIYRANKTTPPKDEHVLTYSLAANTAKNSSFAKSVAIPDLQPRKITTFVVKGQGTIAVKTTASVLSFTIGDPTDNNLLHCAVDSRSILLSTSRGGQPEVPIEYTVRSRKESCYIKGASETVYWLSLDKNNHRLRYGKHFTNNMMTLLEADLKEPHYSWLSTATEINVQVDPAAQAKTAVTVLPLPVTIDQSPFIKPSEEITLLELEECKFTVPTNLPMACQILYGNVAGANIALDDEDFPFFTEAIGRSCETPGAWCYEMLRKKASEHNRPLEYQYLRITIGSNTGNSPGVPYVLEIWPKGHRSVIHDHGRACAIIKVLHGSIVSRYYDSIGGESGPLPLGSARLHKGAVTWLSPENYQIHQLQNQSTQSVCCTIQCYRYERTDHIHLDTFHWRDDQGEVQKFDPNSDMTFGEFRREMKAEWKAYLAQMGEQS